MESNYQSKENEKEKAKKKLNHEINENEYSINSKFQIWRQLRKADLCFQKNDKNGIERSR